MNNFLKDFWGAVISGKYSILEHFRTYHSLRLRQDYQSFASERPEELAQAIQKGIPSTLRGMMWQHM